MDSRRSPDWAADPRILAGFLEWLIDRHNFDEEDILALLYEPRAWQPEYDQFVADATWEGRRAF